MSNERPKLSKYKIVYCPNCCSEIELNLAQRRKEEDIKCAECEEVTELKEVEKFIESLSPVTEGCCPNCDTLLVFEVEERIKDALITCAACEDKFYMDEVLTKDKLKETKSNNRMSSSSVSRKTTEKYTSLSILAFILAFIFPPLGFILGVVAVKEVQNTGEGNDGLAIAAILIGFIWGVILLIYTLS